MLTAIQFSCLSSQRPGLRSFLKSCADVNELSRDPGWTLRGPWNQSPVRREIRLRQHFGIQPIWSAPITSQTEEIVTSVVSWRHHTGSAAGSSLCLEKQQGTKATQGGLIACTFTVISFSKLLEIATLLSLSWKKLYKSRGISLRNLCQEI